MKPTKSHHVWQQKRSNVEGRCNELSFSVRQNYIYEHIILSISDP